MRVLVACEFSGVVRDAFAERGCFAVSADLLPSERPGYHYRGDVRNILADDWDLMIAHPPCTHLSVAGAVWMRYRKEEVFEAIKFFLTLWYAPIPYICIENPVGIIGSQYMKPSQKIEPWQFGHYFRKRTCFWLKSLPRLRATEIIDHRKYDLPSYVQYTQKEGTFGRGHERSRTFPGVAKAMADQWGSNQDILSGSLQSFRAIP